MILFFSMRQTHFISTVQERACPSANWFNELGLNSASACLKGAEPDEAKQGKTLELVRAGWSGSSSWGMIFFFFFVQVHAKVTLKYCDGMK